MAKDRDLMTSVYFLKAAGFIFGPLVIVGVGVFVRWLSTGGLEQSWGRILLMAGAGLAAATVISLLGARAAVWIAGWGSAGLAEVMTGAFSQRDLKEQLSGDVERIRFLRRQGSPGSALALADEVLKKLPDSVEVLSLKAQILWEDCQDPAGSWRHLRRIMKLCPRDDPHHRWAAAYYQQVTGNVEDLADDGEDGGD
ncbi:MAG: hypothetical protein AB1896_02810 [Thermodesulfobacteriota bacterium]